MKYTYILLNSFITCLICWALWGSQPARGTRENPILLYDSSKFPDVWYKADVGSYCNLNLIAYDNIIQQRDSIIKAQANKIEEDSLIMASDKQVIIEMAIKHPKTVNIDHIETLN